MLPRQYQTTDEDTHTPNGHGSGLGELGVETHWRKEKGDSTYPGGLSVP